MNRNRNIPQKPEASVIVAVYNHWEWLRLILDALGRQSTKDFEIVIADDGSDESSVARLREYMDSHPEMRIVHSWQEDKGWRKNLSLNRAVAASQADYLIFIDGDCIPHPRFVSDHLRMRRKGTVIAGRRLDLPKHLSDRTEKLTSLPKHFFCRTRLGILGQIFRQSPGTTLKQLRRSVRFPFLFGRPVGLHGTGILGCNFSIYRSDLMVVNAFDERYPDPGTGEDTDLEIRLANAGIGSVKASRHAVMLHRCHPRLVFDSGPNRRLLESAMRDGVTYVESGLIKKPGGQ